MTTFLDRKEWTDTSSTSNGRWASSPTGISVHYPAAGSRALGGLTKSEVAERLRGWRRLHVGTRGWGDIGYNFAVDQAGRVWELRGFSNVGAHSASAARDPNANTKYLGVLFVVGNTEKITDAAIEAFQDLRAQWLARRPGATIVRGHRDLMATQCPGEPLYRLIKDGSLAKKASTPAPKPKPDPEPAPTADRLRRGSSGTAVGQYQREMNRVFPLYSKLAVDSIFGPATERVTLEFQRRAGLPQTGMVEARDRKALADHGVRLAAIKEPAPKPDPKPDPKPAPKPPKPPKAPKEPAKAELKRGSTGPRVSSLQRQLNSVFPAYRNSVGVNKGRLLAVDAIFGAATEAWVKEFQRRVNLKRTGTLNAATYVALANHGIVV